MKIHGFLVISGVLLLSISSVGCQRQQSKEDASSATYEVIAAAGTVTPSATTKMIDTLALLERQPEEAVAEFTQGPWAVAVRNLKTGYTYYYDSDNTFLGRRK